MDASESMSPFAMSRIFCQQAARSAADRAWQTVKVNWHLGITAFGGPPVHFKIVSLPC
jgi:hypothetical protein